MSIVLVTGSTSGIGLATAGLFIKNRDQVILNGRDERRGQDAVREIERRGGSAHFVRADVTKSAEVDALFEVIKRDFGTIDILVNNAGGARGSDDFGRARYEDFLAGFETNFFSAFSCSQRAVTLMTKGAIVNVGSVCGGCPLPVGESELLPIYSAAKAALHNLTYNLARLLAPRIRVNCVIPGHTRTPLWGKMTPAEETRVANQTFIKRFCTADEIADAIYLVANNGSLTGSQLVIDGGLALGMPR